MSKALHAILKSILLDLKKDNDEVLKEVEETLGNKVVVALLIEAGCPFKYIEAMIDTLPLSYIQRVHCVDQILISLKKIPTKGVAGIN